ncbi:hypothetical protein C1J03_17825 [Sulfitobacter sp. SK012]|uniref:hypothetical protein n=1 Tax=Sulfitobacter sp. SK012 TaxID=1389005 RepID=UPI000E0AB6E4|nr:hypothetical protein [Sulfitobacter sp. SK012]AXI47702.1 hypothetical protein C1J03_17825 [Sulfitobacter sp. SK012]
MKRNALSISVYVLAACLWINHAQAQSCPEYFRFVDFGAITADGSLLRGGPTFKVKRDGEPLFESGSVACTDIEPVFTDGHNQPIPLVTALSYSSNLVAPEMTNLNIKRLSATSAKLAQEPLEGHRIARSAAGNSATQGADFLCVHVDLSPSQTISCEVVSPFDTTLSFIVACNDTACAMSGMAIEKAVNISAGWTISGTATLEEAGATASDIATKIHAFIKDKTAH